LQDKNRNGIIEISEEGEYLLKLSKEFYEKDAVMRAAYKFTDKCTIRIEPIEDRYVGIWFKEKNSLCTGNLSEIANAYCNEVLDQQVQIDLEKSYGDLRNIIYRHAFLPFEE